MIKPHPCGNSLTATVLLKMAAYTGEARYFALAHETLATVTAFVTRRHSAMFGQWLSAFHLPQRYERTLPWLAHLHGCGPSNFCQ